MQKCNKKNISGQIYLRTSAVRDIGTDINAFQWNPNAQNCDHGESAKIMRLYYFATITDCFLNHITDFTL